MALTNRKVKARMKHIAYSQSQGFHEIDVPDWPENGEWEDRLTQLGFEMYGSKIGENDAYPSYTIYLQNHRTPCAWHAMVTLREYLESGGELDILVPTGGDLVALRLQLIQYHVPQLERIARVLEKAFAVWHEHESYENCMACAPDARRLELDQEKSRTEARALEEKRRPLRAALPNRSTIAELLGPGWMFCDWQFRPLATDDDQVWICRPYERFYARQLHTVLFLQLNDSCRVTVSMPDEVVDWNGVFDKLKAHFKPGDEPPPSLPSFVSVKVHPRDESGKLN